MATLEGLNIPQGLGKTLEVTVKDTSDVTRRFLVDLLMRVERLERRVAELEK